MLLDTFFFDSDESGENTDLSIDNNGNATVNVQVDGGFYRACEYLRLKMVLTIRIKTQTSLLKV